MSLRLIGLPLFFASSLALAAGGRSGGPPPARSSPPTAEEAARAATAAEWKDMIEKARSNAPQHPPDPVFHFPSKNGTFLATLRTAENPRVELDHYLNKLWSAATEATRRAALTALFDEAEKPAWARTSIEEFYRKHANGTSLHPPAEPAVAKLGPDTAANKPAVEAAANNKPTAEVAKPADPAKPADSARPADSAKPAADSAKPAADSAKPEKLAPEAANKPAPEPAKLAK